ncbi:hypothetical protein [Angustibacter luteus]|uniref:Uncharacterized protein n=1 Tax=Angustibacter luteus TaxID=658456 RepID=A0ABW1J9G7_9ACTN
MSQAKAMPRIRRAMGRDDGAASLETTGMIAGVALLVAAVVGVLIAASPVFSDNVQRAFCLVFTLGQGDCAPARTTAQEHKPTAPCVVKSDGYDANAEVSFVVTLSNGEKFQVDQLSDGTYRVTRSSSSGVGVEAGVGFDVTVTVDDNKYGAAAKAEASATATFGAGQVFYVKNEDDLNKLIVAHAQDVADDQVAGDSGPGRWLLDHAEGIVGQDHPLPTPDAEFVEGGISLDADANATLGTASAAAGAGVKEILGYQKKRDGSTTEYLRASVDGYAQASVLGGDEDDSSYQLAKAKAEGEVTAIIEIERDAKGNITAVRVRSIMAGEADANEDTLESDDVDHSGYVERTVELPVKNDSDRVLADRFLTAMGMPEVAGINVPPGLATQVAGAPDLLGATTAFAHAAQARGFITEQSYDHESSTNGANFDAEAIAKVGGKVEVATNSRTATGGQYWDGTKFVPWTGCGG